MEIVVRLSISAACPLLSAGGQRIGRKRRCEGRLPALANVGGMVRVSLPTAEVGGSLRVEPTWSQVQTPSLTACQGTVVDRTSDV